VEKWKFIHEGGGRKKELLCDFVVENVQGGKEACLQTARICSALLRSPGDDGWKRSILLASFSLYVVMCFLYVKERYSFLL
jgi:hypothetical protein